MTIVLDCKTRPDKAWNPRDSPTASVLMQIARLVIGHQQLRKSDSFHLFTPPYILFNFALYARLTRAYSAVFRAKSDSRRPKSRRPPRFRPISRRADHR